MTEEKDQGPRKGTQPTTLPGSDRPEGSTRFTPVSPLDRGPSVVAVGRGRVWGHKVRPGRNPRPVVVRPTGPQPTPQTPVSGDLSSVPLTFIGLVLPVLQSEVYAGRLPLVSWFRSLTLVPN